jgi:hypothetical protein
MRDTELPNIGAATVPSADLLIPFFLGLGGLRVRAWARDALRCRSNAGVGPKGRMVVGSRLSRRWPRTRRGRRIRRVGAACHRAGALHDDEARWCGLSDLARRQVPAKWATARISAPPAFRTDGAEGAARQHGRRSPEPQVGALLSRVLAAVHGLGRAAPCLGPGCRSWGDRECDVQPRGCHPDRDVACGRDQAVLFGAFRPCGSKARRGRAHCSWGEIGLGAEPMTSSPCAAARALRFLA